MTPTWPLYTTFTSLTGMASTSQLSISSTIWLICPQLQRHSTDWLYAVTAVPAFKLLKWDITLLLQRGTHSHAVHPDSRTDRSKAFRTRSIPPALKDIFGSNRNQNWHFTFEPTCCSGEMAETPSAGKMILKCFFFTKLSFAGIAPPPPKKEISYSSHFKGVFSFLSGLLL